ncbi:phage major capsid protein [Mycobacterium marinum]|uniref:phage major capsid protein n=1 Tax=Mycobacterium marinum TaxID=1781 RepID=UPI002358B71C|nr:phage major capsid protein [Mycobacterium marinum]MDC8982553.1 phage major capsid protein [Mycobacterium marinum]MDC8999067.1 phage major capsid protein [Mycobacterium marinum]MDC9011511.1 phage major capsid protein [Mycobacterium marinum]
MVETAAANPELLADQVAQLLVQPLEAASVVLSSGVRIFDTAGVLRIPKLTGSSAVGFIAEGEEIPSDHDTTFDELVLMPTDRKSLKTIERYSNELVRQSVLGIDAVLKNRLVKVVGDKLDNELLVGTGTDHAITGIINQAGVQTGTLDVTDADCLLDAIALASAAEVTPNRWFVNGDDFIELRKLKETTGSNKYLLESDVTAGPTYRLFGIEVTPTNKLAQGKAVLADTSQIAVARDLAPSITILTERYAEFDQIGIRVVTRYDLGLLHPEAVIVLTAA